MESGSQQTASTARQSPMRESFRQPGRKAPVSGLSRVRTAPEKSKIGLSLTTSTRFSPRPISVVRFSDWCDFEDHAIGGNGHQSRNLANPALAISPPDCPFCHSTAVGSRTPGPDRRRSLVRARAASRSRAAAAPRRLTCSFSSMSCTWFFTVGRQISSCLAISLFESPLSMSAMMSSSRPVSRASGGRCLVV